MDVSEIFIMIGSMLGSFIFGLVAMLFMGGRTILNYLIVKFSRGKKVLLMARTKFGWRSFISKKNENTLLWKYDKVEITTDVASSDDITRYLRVDMAFVDADDSARVISLKDGALYPADFDPKTFNNILIRALTRPDINGNDELKKMLIAVLILLVVVGFGVMFTYIKLSDLTKIASGGVI